MLYNLYFSPTGGTKKVACQIAEGIDLPSKQINLLEKSTDLSKLELTKDDLVLVSAPCYGGVAPYPAINKLEALKGNNAKAVAIAVYGNRATDDQLLQMQDLLVKNGFTVIAGIEALAEHSLARTVAKGRPDTKDMAVLKDYGNMIFKAFTTDNYNKDLVLPGNRPYKEFKGSGTKPIVPEESKCINCGTCAARCPVNAISEEKPWTTNYDLCISCMHCVSVCPTQARIVDPVKSAGTAKKLMELAPEPKENKIYI